MSSVLCSLASRRTRNPVVVPLPLPRPAFQKSLHSLSSQSDPNPLVLLLFSLGPEAMQIMGDFNGHIVVNLRKKVIPKSPGIIPKR